MNFKIFLVQNYEGKYFRAKGRGGSGDNWVDEPEKARIYTKIGSAKSIVTFYGTHIYMHNTPLHPAPKIIECEVTSIKTLDMRDHINKVKQKKLDKVQELREYHEYVKEAQAAINFNNWKKNKC